MIHAYVQPVILPVYKHIIPLVLIGAAIVVDENAVNEAAVIAQPRQQDGQERGEVCAVAAALVHHLIGKGGNIGIGIVIVEIHTGQVAGRAFSLELRAQDLRLIVRVARQRIRCGGYLRFVEPRRSVPTVADAVPDDPVIDGLNFLRVGFPVGWNLL